jgi:hypothetical protein
MKESYRYIFAVYASITFVTTSWVTNDWDVKLDITKVILTVTAAFNVLYLITREER